MPLLPPNGRTRVVIGDVRRQIAAGRHQIRRVAGNGIVVAPATGGWRFTLLSRRVKA
jgi:hypothetical protein